MKWLDIIRGPIGCILSELDPRQRSFKKSKDENHFCE